MLKLIQKIIKNNNFIKLFSKVIGITAFLNRTWPIHFF
jgi:hypothetical protein